MDPKPDKVLELLVGLHLADHEREFRSLLDSLAGNNEGDEYPTSTLVIALVCLLMSMGQVGWPIVMKTLSTLKRLPDDALKSGAVAIVNGSHLVLPTLDASGEADILVLALTTLRPSPPGAISPALVSTIYSLGAAWEKIEDMRA